MRWVHEHAGTDNPVLGVTFPAKSIVACRRHRVLPGGLPELVPPQAARPDGNAVPCAQSHTDTGRSSLRSGLHLRVLAREEPYPLTSPVSAHSHASRQEPQEACLGVPKATLP